MPGRKRKKHMEMTSDAAVRASISFPLEDIPDP